MPEYKRVDVHDLNKILLLTILLAFSLLFLHLNKTQSYKRYERIAFESSGATLYANLYYPSKSLEFQDKSPLIIYCHGIGSQRDFDLRIPIEFTKRGFYIAALDYQGHGEGGGDIINVDLETGIPALAEDCSKLLDKLITLPFYKNIDPCQIGLIGHSLGGMVVLMNQALDPRFQVTVAWAPLVNFDPQQLEIIQASQYEKYIPANLLNKQNTKNLLIIMHVNDESLNFTTQALKAQELTGCKVIPITEPLIGGGHALFTDKVIIESIKWFESHFFKSEIINGFIKISFLMNYLLILISLSLLFAIVLDLIILTCRVFLTPINVEVPAIETPIEFEKPLSKKRQVIKLVFLSALFVVNWEVFEIIFGLPGIFYASLNFFLIFLIIYSIRFFIQPREKRTELNVKKWIKNQFRLKNFFISIICPYYFILIYIIFSISYPFAFVWPSNILNYFLAIIAFPIYLSLELFYRKVLYPQLFFIKSEHSRSKIMILISIYIHVNLIILTWKWMFFPSVMFMYFIFIIIIIQNTLIYQYTKRFSSVIVYSFEIIQLFFSAIISNAFGIGNVLHFFVNL